MLTWTLLLLYIFRTVMYTNSFLFQDPSYSPDYFFASPNTDTRQNFLQNRKLNRASAKRVKIIDNYLSNNTVFIDGVLHYKIDEKQVQWDQVKIYENAFRNLIGLKGVQFTYRRDAFWRTWRKVAYPKEERVVFYRYQSSMNCSDNTTACEHSGYWTIEENPPCPFEIIAIISNEDLCAINITNNTNIEESCPNVIQFGDLTVKCDNPIDTKWKIQRIYSKHAPEQYPAILCGGRDICELSTSYMITRDYVAFRIINSTNHIIYSRIMKNGKKNYACVKDCGIINPKTKIVSNIDKPLVVDLFNNKTKNKRHNKKAKFSIEIFENWPNKKVSKGVKVWKAFGKISKAEKLRRSNDIEEREEESLHTRKHKQIRKTEKLRRSNDFEEREEESFHSRKHKHHHMHRKHPSCKSMKIKDISEDSFETNLSI